MSYLDILKEAYSSRDHELAIKIVESYDGSDSERVKEAITRLALGSLDGLRYFLEAAKKDYRDVLYWSENEQESRNSTEKVLAGMTVNERLYYTDQFDAFDLAIKANDTESLRKILEKCFIGNENIDAIIKHRINT